MERHILLAHNDSVGSSLYKKFLEYISPSISLDASDDIPPALRSAGKAYDVFVGPVSFPHINIQEDKDGVLITLVNKDMPFLVDSIMAHMSLQGWSVAYCWHAVIPSIRQEDNTLKDIQQDDDAQEESLIIVRLISSVDLSILKSSLVTVLRDIRLAVDDWKFMREQLEQAAQKIAISSEWKSSHAQKDVGDFCAWLLNDNFTFLASRHIVDSQEELSGLAKVYNDELPTLRENHDADSLLITKSVFLSTVHRLVPMDVVRIRIQGISGAYEEFQFFGLYTSSVYMQSILQIPLLRKKALSILAQNSILPHCHKGKAFLHILESFPRDEFLQSSEKSLGDVARQLLFIPQKKEVVLFVREDSLRHFMSVLVYIPRERFSSEMRRRVGSHLSRYFNGVVQSFHVEMGVDFPLARVHFFISKSPDTKAKYNMVELKNALHNLTLSWQERLQILVPEKYQKIYGKFSLSYQEQHSPEQALEDMSACALLSEEKNLQVRLHSDAAAGTYVRIYHKEQSLNLSHILPIFQHMDLEVRTETAYSLHADTGEVYWIHAFFLGACSFTKEEGSRICEALLATWQGINENDTFNALVLHAGLSWRAVALFRAYYRYLRQIDPVYSQDYVSQCLKKYGDITQNIYGIFQGLLSPYEEKIAIEPALESVENSIDTVASQEDERIIKRFLNLVLSTLRTNFFQQGGTKPYIALKFDSRLIENMPQPRPMYEIFVCAPWMEAIHLRGGRVARGGIRWSDRQEDFRTEVLGLLKAQLVKNAVIVPMGAKGGFIIKACPLLHKKGDIHAQAIFCYETMIHGMLDITDNLVKDTVCKPEDVVCLDKDDPYLVVAADKGTARFSDCANGIASERGFWLGDAFASGGSKGYDHKKMAITSRGAWTSVERHFREMGRDIKKETFTVIGVGDMSGDVFGNGMLLSSTIRLIGAFNHTHIFLDPDPDAEASYKERARLFAMPRSTWEDYDQSVLSSGGGVYARNAKRLNVSTQVQQLLSLSSKSITPDELIRTLLSYRVDLLWFGGIGTFIKESTEDHASVGDKANDSVRVNGADVQASIIVEGANLGVTQKGRIEYARLGGRLNTDFIDNSAGVDCSDHEVNIKILLQQVCEDGGLSSEERDALLGSMEEDVATLVLRNTYLQNQAISMIQERGYHVLNRQNRLLHSIERIGKLNRSVEYLPGDKEMTDRVQSHTGLLRPEISILLSYGKLFARDHILQSDIVHDTHVDDIILGYFPPALRQRFADYITRHPLRQEIIATMLANSLVNRLGPTFLNEMMVRTGATAQEVLKAYILVRSTFSIQGLWKDIETLSVSHTTQSRLFLYVVEFVEKATFWLLMRKVCNTQLASVASMYTSDIHRYIKALTPALYDIIPSVKKRYEKLIDLDVPGSIVNELMQLRLCQFAYPIVSSAKKAGISVEKMTDLYIRLYNILSLDELISFTDRDAFDTTWNRLAMVSIRQELEVHIDTLAIAVTQQGGIDNWLQTNKLACSEIQELIGQAVKEAENGLAAVHVCVTRLGDFVHNLLR